MLLYSLTATAAGALFLVSQSMTLCHELMGRDMALLRVAVAVLFWIHDNVLTANGITAACTFAMTIIAGFALKFAKGQVEESHKQAQVQHFLTFNREFSQNR